MTSSSPSRTAFQTGTAAVLAALLVAACAWLQHTRETRFPMDDTAREEALYFTSGEALGRLTQGYHALAADLYWIRTIQYYGGTKRSAAASADKVDPDYRLLYPLLDITTTLDPHFNIAYRFGAIFLAEARPSGAGRPDLAVALLEKGLHAKPDKWEYMQDIGFVEYWWRHDYPAAAGWFNRAADVPDAPWWLRSLAASTLAEGGDRRASRLMWEALRQSAEVDWLRTDAERRLLQLQALDEIDLLQAVVDRFAAATGSRPADWAPLVRAGALRSTPLDPMKSPYVIDGAGRVRVALQSPLFPLPEEPQRLQPPS